MITFWLSFIEMFLLQYLLRHLITTDYSLANDVYRTFGDADKLSKFWQLGFWDLPIGTGKLIGNKEKK